MKHKAVVAVQPFAVSSAARSASDPVSTSVPTDKYPISVRGSTISLAGNPRIKASKITPSKPMQRPMGSRAWAHRVKRDAGDLDVAKHPNQQPGRCSNQNGTPQDE